MGSTPLVQRTRKPAHQTWVSVLGFRIATVYHPTWPTDRNLLLIPLRQHSTITSGVPQRSVLGPILFVLYTSLVSAIAEAHGVSQQQYVDANQLYISISSETISSNTVCLEACLSYLHSWFSHNWLALNPSKSDAILLGTSKKLATLSDLIPCISPAPLYLYLIMLSFLALRSTGVSLSIPTLHLSLNLVSTTSVLFRHIRPILSEGTVNLIASSLVSCRLDYANACLFGIFVKNTALLQRVQNTLARVVTVSHQYSTIAETPPLASGLISHTVHKVCAKAARSIYALKVLRAHGLQGS